MLLWLHKNAFLQSACRSVAKRNSLLSDMLMKKTVFKAAFFPFFTEKKVIEYVEQHVTTLVMMYSPTVNDTHYPLGTATTCPADRYACADLVPLLIQSGRHSYSLHFMESHGRNRACNFLAGLISNLTCS